MKLQGPQVLLDWQRLKIFYKERFMTKSKSRFAILAVAIMMCVSLVLGFSFNKNTLTAYAESGYLPKIISVTDKNGKVTYVSEKDNMVNMPIGVVGDEYYAKVVTENKNDIVYIKPYAEGTRGCLPQGLVFNPETKELLAHPQKARAVFLVTFKFIATMNTAQ